MSNTFYSPPADPLVRSLPTGPRSLLGSIRNDDTANAFGIGMSISGEPVAVSAQILYPVKLCYGENRSIEPKLNGSWNLAGAVKVAYPPPLAAPSSFSSAGPYA